MLKLLKVKKLNFTLNISNKLWKLIQKLFPLSEIVLIEPIVCKLSNNFSPNSVSMASVFQIRSEFPGVGQPVFQIHNDLQKQTKDHCQSPISKFTHLVWNASSSILDLNVLFQ